MSAATPHLMSAAEFLSWERLQPAKHAFQHGEAFAMAGGSPRHNVLSAKVIRRLDESLAPHGCAVLTSDQEIALRLGEEYGYADAVVVCGEFLTEDGTTDVLRNPSVVVEVLSRSTEAYDRGEKWERYQRIESLTDYILVAQRAVRVEHFHRATDGSWSYRMLGAGDIIALDHGTVSVDAIYAGAFTFKSDEG